MLRMQRDVCRSTLWIGVALVTVWAQVSSCDSNQHPPLVLLAASVASYTHTMAFSTP